MSAAFPQMNPEQAKALLRASQQPNSFQFFGGLAPVVAAGALDTPASLYGLAQAAYSAPREGESFFERANRYHDRFPFGKQTGALYGMAQDFANRQGLDLPLQTLAEVATPLPSFGKAKAATAALGALAASPIADAVRSIPEFAQSLPDAFLAAVPGFFHGTKNRLREVEALGRLAPDMQMAKPGATGQGFYASNNFGTARGYSNNYNGGVYGIQLDLDPEMQELLRLWDPIEDLGDTVTGRLESALPEIGLQLGDIESLTSRPYARGVDVLSTLEDELGRKGAADFLRESGVPGLLDDQLTDDLRVTMFDPTRVFVDRFATDPRLIQGQRLGAPSLYPNAPRSIVPVNRVGIQRGGGLASKLPRFELQNLRLDNQGAFIDPVSGTNVTGQTLAPGAVVSTTGPKVSYTGSIDDGLEVTQKAGGQGPYINHNLVRGRVEGSGKAHQYEYIGKDGIPRVLNRPIAALESEAAFKTSNPSRNKEGKGFGHVYGNDVEWRVPSEMKRHDKAGEPHLRPRARGDVYGIGDAGKVKIGGNIHPLYEKLIVVPKGEDPGIKGARLLTGDKAPKPSRKYTSVAPSLRHLKNHSEAIKIAQSEPHLVKASGRGEKSGIYTGSPNTVQSDTDLQRMRERYDALVELGQSIPGVGPDWYKRIAANWKKIAPGRETLAAEEFAMFSPQATPKVNFDFQMQAHNAYERGTPLDKAKTTAQAKQYKKYRETGDPDLSLKTGPFAQAGDPTRPATIGGTHDIWDARAWGYEGKAGEDWSEGLSENQHRFMDYETVLAVERANQKKLGGRSNWTADEIQASTWVAMGGKDRLKQFDGDIEAAMRSMGDTEEFIPATAFHSTYEVIPDAAGIHLPGVAGLDEEARAAFTMDPARSYTDPKTGQDMIYRAMGMYGLPTEQGVGSFVNPITKQLEVNPNFDARPLVDFAKGPLRRGSQVNRDTLRMVEAAEGLRGALDYQSGSAGHKSLRIGERGTSAGDATGFGIDHGRLTAAQQQSLQQVLQDQGLSEYPYITMSRPESTVIGYGTDQGTGLGGLTLKGINQRKKQEEALIGALSDAGLPADVDRRAVDSFYVDYSDARANPGQGEATRILQDLFDKPATRSLVAKIDASQELRDRAAAVMAANARDAAAMGDTLDPAQQTFLDIFSKEGLSGVFKALEAGTILPAVALPLLAPLLMQMDQGGMPEAA